VVLARHTGHVTIVVMATAAAVCEWSVTGAVLFVSDEVYGFGETSLAQTADDDITCQFHAIISSFLVFEPRPWTFCTIHISSQPMAYLRFQKWGLTLPFPLSHFLPLEVGPFNPARGSLPPAGPGKARSLNDICCILG